MIKQEQVYGEKIILEAKTKHHRHAIHKVLKDFGFAEDTQKVEKVAVSFALTDGELSFLVHLEFPRSLDLGPKTHIDLIPEDKIAFYLGVMDVLLKHPSRIQQAFQSPTKIELPTKLEGPSAEDPIFPPVKAEDLSLPAPGPGAFPPAQPGEPVNFDEVQKVPCVTVDNLDKRDAAATTKALQEVAGRVRQIINTSPELIKVRELNPIHYFTTIEGGLEYVLRQPDNSKTVYRAELPGVLKDWPEVPVGQSYRNDETGIVHLPDGIPPETRPEPTEADQKERIYRTNIGLLAANLIDPAMAVLSSIVENGPQSPEVLVELCEGAEDGLKELIRWKVVEMVVHGDTNLYGAPKAGRDVYLFRYGDVQSVAKARDNRVQQCLLQKIIDFRHRTGADTLHVLYQILVNEPEVAVEEFPADWNEQKKVLGVSEFGRNTHAEWASSASYMNSNRLLRRYQLPVVRGGQRRTEPVVFLTQKALDVFMLANGRSRTLADALLFYRNNHKSADA